MSQQFAWAEDPPPPSRIDKQVFRPAKNSTNFVRFLGAIVGVYMHWHALEKKSLPCTGPDCSLCPEPRRWKGYAPALLWRHIEKNWAPIVADITENSIEITRENEPLRGKIFEVRRPGQRNNSPIIMTFREDKGTDNLPEPFDVKPILVRLWGYQLRSSELRTSDNHENILPFTKSG